MAFYMFLALTEKTKQSIIEQFENKLKNEVDETFFSDYFDDDLYHMATHYYLEYIDDFDIELAELTDDNLLFNVYGSVVYRMQLGSDGDWRRGDGLAWEMSFPYLITFRIDIDKLHESELELLNIDIDIDIDISFDNSHSSSRFIPDP